MPAQKSYHEASIKENHHGLKTRPILGLKTKSRFSIPAQPLPNTRLFGHTQYSRLENPLTGGRVFGYVPAIQGLPRDHRTTAPVILPFGRHNDHLSGYGAQHILTRHSDVVSERDSHNVQGVADFIATVLQGGASLFWQGPCEDGFRICAFRPGIAKVVLGYRNKHGEARWNVITAFRAHRCDGDFVGSLIPVPVRIAA